MATDHGLYRSGFSLIFTFLLGQAGLDNHKFYHNGYYQARAFVRVQPWFVFSCTSRLCHRSCWAFVRHLGSPSACYQLVWVRFLGRRLLYFCNGTSSFNPSVIRILIGGDIHPQPGPNLTALRGSPTARTVASKIYLPRDAHWNIKIAHLNVRSLKFRENFILIKDTIQSNGFDIFTISETWLDSSVPDAFVYTPGYTIFRQGRGPHKAGGGLCVY